MDIREINTQLIERAKTEAHNLFKNHPDRKERNEVLRGMREMVVRPIERLKSDNPSAITDDMIKSAKISEMVEAHIKDTLEPEAQGLKPDVDADRRLGALANGRLYTNYMGSTRADTSKPSIAGRAQLAREDAKSPQREAQTYNGIRPVTINSL